MWPHAKMADIVPSCFGEYGVQMPELSIGRAMVQNLVTCQYQTKFAGLCRHVTVMWVKNVLGQGLCVTVEDPSCQYTCQVQMKPWYFWRKQGSKRFEVYGSKVEVFWDLSSAKYACGPEPSEGYYVAVVSNNEVVLLLGDRCQEAYKRTKARQLILDPTLLSRKEHVFGKKYYCTKVQLDEGGKAHDIVIECHTSGPKEPFLSIRIDRKLVVQVQRLIWKFRGNQTVLVDGSPLEIYWDVHNWLFNPASAGHAMFMFQSSTLSAQISPAATKDHAVHGSATKARSGELIAAPRKCAAKLRGTHSLRSKLGAFSFMLYAWRSD